jgi:fibronectin-binding autotransporter adhesin
VRSDSTLRLGATNALPADATLTIGQASDGSASIFEMNGFDQTVSGLLSNIGNASNNRRVTNSSATLSTLTLDGSVDRIFGNSTGNTGGNITGNIAIVKNGTNTQTFSGPANTYTGNVTVNSGTLIADGNQNSTALGSPITAGRTITVNSGATLSFTTNNVFGNGVNNNNLPSTALNGGTLTSIRYNVLGDVTLNGATLTQAATDAGAYEGYQFRGNVTVGGSTASTIATTNGKANHLNSNTVFNVANATGSAATDLLVSTPLRNQSGDFGNATGGLTKIGPGTLELSAANPFTGSTTVTDGTLLVTGSITGSAVTVNGGTIAGTGSVGALLVNAAGTLAPGASPGTLTATDVTFAGGTFALELNGAAAGQADQLIANGLVSLISNTPLAILLGFDPTDNVDSFIVISKNSPGAVDTTGGLFSVNGVPLGEGALFTISGQDFRISYVGGDGNDVVLMAIPEPGSVTALIAGLGALVGLRRPRRKH